MRNLINLFKIKDLREEFIKIYSNIPPFELIPIGIRDKNKSIDSFCKRYFNNFDANFFKEEIKYDEFILDIDNIYQIGNLYEKSAICHINYYINKITVNSPYLKKKSIIVEKEKPITMKDINPFMYSENEHNELETNFLHNHNFESIKNNYYSNENDLLLSMKDSLDLFNLINIFYYIISSDKIIYDEIAKTFVKSFEIFILDNFNNYRNIKITSILILIYCLTAVSLSKLFGDEIIINKIINNIRRILELDNISEYEIMEKKMQYIFNN